MSTESVYLEAQLPFHSIFDPSRVDINAAANAWLHALGEGCEKADIPLLLELIWEDGFWRDILALTWSYRSIGGKDGGRDRIEAALEARIPVVGFSNFRIDERSPPSVAKIHDNITLIVFAFNFESAVGTCSGVARLIPSAEGGWEAFTVSTVLETLNGFTEKTGRLREAGHIAIGSTFYDQRRASVDFRDADPDVLLIGAGQCGLSVAARLKVLDVSTLLVDTLPRVGDNWRGRYESLRLHDPCHYDHLPFMPFPSTWPVYPPGVKLADWLESYARIMDLNIWSSSRITKSEYNNGSWVIQIDRMLEDGSVEQRTLRPKHVVWACGLGGGEKNLPVIEGSELFRGKIIHSAEHRSGKDWAGKKAVVVGACASGHDISFDLCNHGVDVTMVQRSSTYIMSVDRGMPILMGTLYSEDGPPVEQADRFRISMPNAVGAQLGKRTVKILREADKELLAGLEKRGFKLNWGPEDAGFATLGPRKASGYYLDHGASQYIVDGKIKLKSGHVISRFTEDHIIFDDGTKMEADLVVFATGYGNARSAIRRVLGDNVWENCKPCWGINYEHEIQGVWGSTGVPNFWVMMGGLAQSRFNSKMMALQIKAQLEGIFKESDRLEPQSGPTELRSKPSRTLSRAKKIAAFIAMDKLSAISDQPAVSEPIEPPVVDDPVPSQVVGFRPANTARFRDFSFRRSLYNFAQLSVLLLSVCLLFLF